MTLEIVDIQPGTAIMQWSPLGGSRPTTRLDVGPCPGDGYEWIVFSGDGYEWIVFSGDL